MNLDRFARLFETLCLIGCGIALGAVGAMVRVRHSVAAEFQQRLDDCVADRDAHDRFIRLVVGDVENAVDRAGALLKSSRGYVQAAKPTDPPTAFAADRWWVFVDGRWEPMEVMP